MHEKTTEAGAANIFTELRASAAALLKAHPDVVRVFEAAIDRLVAGSRPALTAQEVKAKGERVGLPLKFSNPLEELNFHATAALLSFGAAYEAPTTNNDNNGPSGQHLGESARDTVLFGLIGLHLTKADLHAGFLCAATRSDVSSYFAIDPMESVPHASTPAIRIERPGPLSAYVDDLVNTMHTTGQRLKELGAPDMARFLLAATKSDETGSPTAARMVTALAAAFPTAFAEPLPGPGAFVGHKKALLLAGEAFHRLRHSLPELAFSDFARAPGYATPGVITRLVEMGVLAPPPAEGEEGRVDDDEAGRARLLGDAAHVGVLAAAAVMALDAWAAKWEVAPLDLAYSLDEVLGKEEGGQQQLQEQQEQQEPQGQEEQGAKAPPPPAKFVPPRGQTVM